MKQGGGQYKIKQCNSTNINRNTNYIEGKDLNNATQQILIETQI